VGGRWEKRGRVYETRPGGPFASHAQLPTVDRLSDERWRIYLAARDAQNQANTTSIDVEAGNPTRILAERGEPILPLGPEGAFDSAGLMPAWLVELDDGTKYLFYTGWKLAAETPYELAIGLAESRDGGESWRKVQDEPVLGLTPDEPYTVGSPCVLRDNGLWRCWYFCSTEWTTVEDRLEAVYHIRYAESDDGIHWRRDGTVAIDYEAKDEAIARGSVVRDADRYRMWYAYRKTSGFRDDPSRSYRIGYAESPDGVAWTRVDDAAGIDVSDDGWDSAMIAYPYVFDHAGTRYLFYNGNGFGQTGFGYAVWAASSGTAS
jgi:hypothetical protein